MGGTHLRKSWMKMDNSTAYNLFLNIAHIGDFFLLDKRNNLVIHLNNYLNNY